MNRSRLIVVYVMSFALFGCGGGSDYKASTPAQPNAAALLEVFVRDALKEDKSAAPREINDVSFNAEVREATFDDVFPR